MIIRLWSKIPYKFKLILANKKKQNVSLPKKVFGFKNVNVIG